MRRTQVTTLAVVAAGALLTACGSDDDSSEHGGSHADSTMTSMAPSSTPSPPGSAATATFNDADVVFAQGMIPHHEQAIEMAEMALDPAVGASPAVLDLAGRIRAAQDPEIQLMIGWLDAWGQPVTMDASDGHEMSEMDGMMGAEEMDALASTTGAEFDAMWMEMMIRHHEGAITQAETEKAEGTNPDALALADAIITAQQAEIDEMRALLAG